MVYGIDICNTIADVNGVLEKVLGPNPIPSNYRHPKATEEFWLNNLWVYAAALPIKHAAEQLRLLSRNNKLVYITARPVQAADITVKWLKEHGFPQSEVIFTDNKVAVAKNLGVQQVIDDAPHEIEAYLRAGFDVKVKSQPYNQMYAQMYANLFNWA